MSADPFGTERLGGRRELRDVAGRWHTAHATGTLPPALLAGRPVEEVAAVAELVDLDLPPRETPRAAEERRATTPAAVRELLPTAPQEWWQCDELAVAGHAVDWWVHDGEVWATTTAGLARALAQAAGDWAARYAVEILLAEPQRLLEMLVERVGER